MNAANAKPPYEGNVLQLDDRRHARLGWLLMLGGFLGFLAWAALAPLDKGVAVSGKVMVSGNRKVVQHPSGGIVERIDVRDGDRVLAGQVLIRLKETPLLGQAQSLRSQFYGSLASEARLNAEVEGAASVSFPAELMALHHEPEVASNLVLQQQLFASRRQALLLDQQGIGESIAGAEAQLRGVREIGRAHV